MLLVWRGVNASDTGEKGRLGKDGRTPDVVAAGLVSPLDRPGGQHPKPLRWRQGCPERSAADFCSISSVQKVWPGESTLLQKGRKGFLGMLVTAHRKDSCSENFSPLWTLRVTETETRTNRKEKHRRK